MKQNWNRLWSRVWRKQAALVVKPKRQRISKPVLSVLYNSGVAVFALWLLHGVVAKKGAVLFLMPFIRIFDQVGWLGAAAAVALPAIAGLAIILLMPAKREEIPPLPEEEKAACERILEKCELLSKEAPQGDPGFGWMFFLPILIVLAEYLFLALVVPGASFEAEGLLIALITAAAAAAAGALLLILFGNQSSVSYFQKIGDAAAKRLEALHREQVAADAEKAVTLLDEGGYQQAVSMLKEAVALEMPEPMIQYVYCCKQLEDYKASFDGWIEMLRAAREKGGLSERWAAIADQLEGEMLYAIAFTDYKPAGIEDMELMQMAAELGHEKAKAAMAHYEERQSGASEGKITIRNQGWLAEISPGRGANIDRLCRGERLIYRRGNWEEEPCLQGSPILMPSNRTYKGKFTFEGKKYRLPLNEPANRAHLHGRVYQQEFAVKQASEDEVTLVYENSGEIYPFPFEMEVTYRAAEAFEQYYTVTNIGDTAMPLTFGLHTTFEEPAEFSVLLESCQQKDRHHIPTGKYVPLNEQEQQYLAGSPSQGLVISGYYRAAGHTAQIGDLTYEVSENFDHWILFNGRGESGFLCVEPQCGAVNGLNNGCCSILQPGERITFWAKIKV